MLKTLLRNFVVDGVVITPTRCFIFHIYLLDDLFTMLYLFIFVLMIYLCMFYLFIRCYLFNYLLLAEFSGSLIVEFPSVTSFVHDPPSPSTRGWVVFIFRPIVPRNKNYY